MLVDMEGMAGWATVLLAVARILTAWLTSLMLKASEAVTPSSTSSAKIRSMADGVVLVICLLSAMLLRVS